MSVSLNSLISAWLMSAADGADSFGANALTLPGGANNPTVHASSSPLGGDCLTFTRASSQSMSIASNATLTMGPSPDATHMAGSWSGWFKPTTTSTVMALLFKGNGNTVTSVANVEFILLINSTNKLAFRASDGTTNVAAATLNSVNASAWNFFAATIDASGNIICTLNDDTANKGTATLANGIQVQANPFYIGGSASGNYFGGDLYQFAFWKRVLSAGDQTALYNAAAAYAYPFGSLVQTATPSVLVVLSHSMAIGSNVTNFAYPEQLFVLKNGWRVVINCGIGGSKFGTGAGSGDDMIYRFNNYILGKYALASPRYLLISGCVNDIDNDGITGTGGGDDAKTRLKAIVTAAVADGWGTSPNKIIVVPDVPFYKGWASAAATKQGYQQNLRTYITGTLVSDYAGSNVVVVDDYASLLDAADLLLSKDNLSGSNTVSPDYTTEDGSANKNAHFNSLGSNVRANALLSVA